MKQYAKYEGYNESSVQIKWLWEFLKSLDEENKA